MGSLQPAFGDGNMRFVNGLLLVWDSESEAFGYMDKNGKIAIKCQFKNASNFSQEVARVSVVLNHNELMGFIDLQGRFVIPPKFDIDFDFSRNGTDFSEDLAGVIDGPPTVMSDSKFNYLDRSGRVVLRTDFSRAEPFKGGLAAVYDSETNKFGFIDKTGHLRIPLRYGLARDFSDGLVYVEDPD